jgi:outer membrane protein OmpA-like peptidoglycan-associated protein
MQSQSYGGNIGLRFFLGKKAERIAITNTNSYNPTICGLCDGSFELHGLKPGGKAVVSYNVNGSSSPNAYAATANNEGTVTVPGLCAGSYTDIKTTVGKSTANSKPVQLVAPKLVISRVESNNPTGAGKCDGTMSFYGLHAGQQATVTYTRNGVKDSYTNTVSADNSLKVTGLCSGTFTNMVIESNKCIVEINNPGTIALKDPQPPVVEEPDTMTQVLFDFNKSEIRPSSYFVIDRVFEKLQKDNLAYVVIDGNTDKIGTDEYNQKLSERRAAAVKAYLMNKGIDENRIRNRGNGEREPVAPNETAEGRSRNRRAELLIMVN